MDKSKSNSSSVGNELIAISSDEGSDDAKAVEAKRTFYDRVGEIRHTVPSATMNKPSTSKGKSTTGPMKYPVPPGLSKKRKRDNSPSRSDNSQPNPIGGNSSQPSTIKSEPLTFGMPNPISGNNSQPNTTQYAPFPFGMPNPMSGNNFQPNMAQFAPFAFGMPNPMGGNNFPPNAFQFAPFAFGMPNPMGGNNFPPNMAQFGAFPFGMPNPNPIPGDNSQPNTTPFGPFPFGMPNPTAGGASSRGNPTDDGAGESSASPSTLGGKKYKKEVQAFNPDHSFQDVAGMDNVLKQLCKILMHIKQPDVYFKLGLIPPKGLLLHGPSGCGKTFLARSIAGQLELPLIEVAATELISGVSGESEERICDVFEQALASAPCVLFIDEIDALCTYRYNAQQWMERPIIIQLMSSLDNLQITTHQPVLVIGTTSRPEVLDPSLRRVGRFDHYIPIGIPNRNDRRQILTIICGALTVMVHPNIDFDKIAALTPGYVGADLLALVACAESIAVNRQYTQQIKKHKQKSQRNIPIVDPVDEAQTEEPDKQESSSPGVTVAKESTVNIAAGSKASTSKDYDSATTTDTSEPKMKNVEQVGSTTKDTSKEVSSGEKSPVNEEPIDELPEQDPELLPELTLNDLIDMLANTFIDIQRFSDICITMEDLKEAVGKVQPSAKLEGFITIPDVTWDDVGSLHDIREELKLAVLAPVKFPDILNRLGLSAPTGVLLCGPPGCGKTLLANAIANESGINFISVKAPELMNMYVGETERAVREYFHRARSSVPCLMFFDEFDTLCPKQSENNENASGARILNQLLTEMDGVDHRKGVYILAATNRPDVIDPAFLRPGRFDKVIYVGLPQIKDREEILMAITKNRKKPILHDDVDFAYLAAKTGGFSGADLAALVRQAAVLAFKECTNNPDMNLDDIFVTANHFQVALTFLRSSVNAEERQMYDRIKKEYAVPRIKIEDEE